ncbi:MAG: hypothetical protein IJ875_06625 [Solobacterium sp.]|nr:hypothetical protein [Solobacterium sp.]
MARTEEKTLNSITYTYTIGSITKRNMLDHIYTILEDDDITSHGLILTEARPDGNWLGTPLELPTLPDKAVFLDYYEKIRIGCMTAIMEYHGMPLILSYRPNDKALALIIPEENSASIDEIEKNVIPNEIDHN